MLTINSIRDGIVIDHIKAGRGIKIFNYLKLDEVEFRVALIMNVDSKQLGRKDMIKIENVIDIDYAILGLIDPNITVNIIRNEQREKKINLKLPSKIQNVIKCKNPRCITASERSINHIFYLVNEEKKEYRCFYCDEAIKFDECNDITRG